MEEGEGGGSCWCCLSGVHSNPPHPHTAPLLKQDQVLAYASLEVQAPPYPKTLNSQQGITTEDQEWKNKVQVREVEGGEDILTVQKEKAETSCTV